MNAGTLEPWNIRTVFFLHIDTSKTWRGNQDGETGVLVPPRDHQALTEAIVRLLKDDDRRARMGRAGFERVRRMFSAERMVEETLTVYRAVVASRRAYPARKADTDPSAGMPSPPSRG